MKNAVIMLLNNLQSKDGEFSFAEHLKLNNLIIRQCKYEPIEPLTLSLQRRTAVKYWQELSRNAYH